MAAFTFSFVSFDPAHRAQVGVGVDGLGLGRGLEELRHVGEAVLLGLLGEREVLAVGLALAGERGLEVIE